MRWRRCRARAHSTASSATRWAWKSRLSLLRPLQVTRGRTRRPARESCGADATIAASASLDRLLVHLGDVIPVDQVLHERLEVIRPAVAIVDVVGVLPHVAAENRLGAVHQRVLAVRR